MKPAKNIGSEVRPITENKNLNVLLALEDLTLGLYPSSTIRRVIEKAELKKKAWVYQHKIHTTKKNTYMNHVLVYNIKKNTFTEIFFCTQKSGNWQKRINAIIKKG